MCFYPHFKNVAKRNTLRLMREMHHYLCYMCSIHFTFIEVYLVSEYDHAFSEQLILQILSEERAQLGLQQLSEKTNHNRAA